ncbi:MAG: hypothetical protein E7353_02710 [Clostridiales bacterium]|nr:hypothetical protein [Clostridiales bacterium]
MKHKKKIIISIMAVIMLVCAFVGVSMAYFTDSTTSPNNVISTGRISIQQLETNRNGQAINLTNISLLPVVERATKTETVNIGEDEKLRALTFVTHKNAIERVVSLKNTGANNAYVRTLIAVPKVNNKDLIKIVKNEYSDIIWTTVDGVTIDGVVNTIWVATYQEALVKDETSVPSLLQFYLDKTATSEDMVGISQVSISVVSQAVQQGGFEDVGAAGALDEAFGAITTTHHPFA